MHLGDKRLQASVVGTLMLEGEEARVNAHANNDDLSTTDLG